GGEPLVDVIDAILIRQGKARPAAPGDAVDLKVAHLMPEGEVGEMVFDGPTVDGRTGCLLFCQPGYCFVQARTSVVHLEKELVARGTGAHMPSRCRHSWIGGPCSV